MAINSHKSSSCNQSQFNFAVSDDIKCLLQTNLNLISNKAINKKWNLFFKIRTKIIDLAWKIVPVLQFKVFWDYDSTIIKRSRRSGFITSLQKFWTVFHFLLVYSTSRFIDTFSEVTDSGTDTASQQSNFLTWSIWALIFLQRPNISRLRTLHYKFIWNFFLQSPGCCCRTQAMVCELTFNSSVFA